MMRGGSRSLLAVLALPTLATGGCPFLGEGHPPAGHPPLGSERERRFARALETIDFDGVKKDIIAALTDSKEWWPADFGNYGPLFVRLAWHCSGSYRSSDGRGGCDGGRIRFEPELSWEDNTNLDKARRLLSAIKAKHGAGLSWGDLIVLAGNTAIEQMGGPVLGFCAGRIDAADGTESLPLGPSAEQEQLFACGAQGSCEKPLGTTTVGLIYVNPEGPNGFADPIGSALEIRDVFGRMGMNDSETVALIGGGHAFGKGHGACTAGPGPSPKDDPANPWPGACGTGVGADTFTSGFDVQWTPTPTSWGNAFFKQLDKYNWTKFTGDGGKTLWRAEGAPPEMANVSMLTSDVALINDPTGKYGRLVKVFAGNLWELETAFKHAWYKLTTRDMGPATRCFGKDVPPPQPWQNPLPAAPERVADYAAVRRDIVDLLTTPKDDIVIADTFDGKAYYGAFLVRLAWHCSATFRMSDYRGGCNGARIRHTPEIEWEANKGLSDAVRLLETVKERHDSISWADLIVLAGTVAIEEAGGRKMRFCGGRTDAEDGSGSEGLTFRFPADLEDAARLKDNARLLGITNREFVVLVGGGHALGKMHRSRSGFMGQWTPDPMRLSNDYFRVLLEEEWDQGTVEVRRQNGTAQKLKQFRAKGNKALFMLPADIVMRTDPEFNAISESYAADNDLFLDDFAAAWVRLVEADRYRGPVHSVCEEGRDDLARDEDAKPASSRSSLVAAAVPPAMAVALLGPVLATAAAAPLG